MYCAAHLFGLAASERRLLMRMALRTTYVSCLGHLLGLATLKQRRMLHAYGFKNDVVSCVALGLPRGFKNDECYMRLAL